MPIEWTLYKEIRQRYLVEKKSQRLISRELRVSRKTIAKYCGGSTLPDSRKITERASPLRTATMNTILRLLEENKNLPRKQKLTAKKIWEHLVTVEGFAIAEPTVRHYVAELRKQHPDIFIPLAHDPGEAIQFDWGDMPVILDGVRTVISVFCAALPHSGAILSFVYPDKSMLSFLEGHIQTFQMLGGVPIHCVYDNLRTAVFKNSGKNAVKNKSFARMEAHYAFEAVFCNVESGWEKSSVENAVAIVRSLAFTPMPRVKSFSELQEHVSNKCLQYIRDHRIAHRSKSIQQEFEEDRAALLPLPGVPLDNGFTTTALVHPDLTVRCENVRYSVPDEFVGKQVALKLSPFHLTVFYAGQEVYRHNRARSSDEHQYVLDHYLQILSRKARAIDQAIPLRQGIMPQECREFLQLCREKDAKKQLVDILLLGRSFSKEKLLWAIQQANSTLYPTLAQVCMYLQIGLTEQNLTGPDIQPSELDVYDTLLDKGDESDGSECTHFPSR